MGRAAVILLDTKALIRAHFGLPEPGECARTAIAQAGSAGTVAGSAISFWEAAVLAAKSRIAPPVNRDTGIETNELAGLHADPVDRLICATALHAGATLLTADSALLSRDGPMLRMDARG